MLINVDMDKLLDRKKQLELELDKIKFSLEMIETLKTVETPIVSEKINIKKDVAYHRTVGKTRAVFISLYTGPATDEEIISTLKWDNRKGKKVIANMIERRWIFRNESGYLCLSAIGKKMTEWYLNNPNKLIYGGEK